MHKTFSLQGESTVAAYRMLLVGGEPTLSVADLARLSGTDVARVSQYRVAMGYSVTDDEHKVFTQQDLDSYRRWMELVNTGQMDYSTALSLIRALSHVTDRLVLWQVEALVNDVVQRLGLDDTSARIMTLDSIRSFIGIFEEELVYTWRRQMESMLTRVDSEVSHRGASPGNKGFPLMRTFGFIDMVSYTSKSQTLPENDLVRLVNEFEEICRQTIAECGGRVVKFIGDAVFYIADDLPTGLRVVTTLMDRLNSTPSILSVRASIVQGSVFSRSGDVFGPCVNLASRLVGCATVGKIFTDAQTAQSIMDGQGGPSYVVCAEPDTQVHGVGRISPFVVSRRDGEPL